MMPALRRSPRIASRNFFGMLLASAISTACVVSPGGSAARWTRALRPYFPLAVSIVGVAGQIRIGERFEEFQFDNLQRGYFIAKSARFGRRQGKYRRFPLSRALASPQLTRAA